MKLIIQVTAEMEPEALETYPCNMLSDTSLNS